MILKWGVSSLRRNYNTKAGMHVFECYHQNLMVVIKSSEVMKVPCGLLKLCYFISFSQMLVLHNTHWGHWNFRARRQAATNKLKPKQIHGKHIHTVDEERTLAEKAERKKVKWKRVEKK